MNPGAVPVPVGVVRLGAAVWANWRWDTTYHWDVGWGPAKGPYPQARSRMRTQVHRIVDTDHKRGNVVVRVTDTCHDEPTYGSEG